MPDNYPIVLRGGLLTTRAERKLERAQAEVVAQAAVARMRDRAEIARIADTTKVGMRAGLAIAADVRLAPSDPFSQLVARVVGEAGVRGIAGVVDSAGLGF